MEKAPGAKVFDLFLFMGQSNMAGRGITSEKWPQKAPVPDTEAGAEFRAVSDPSRLYPVREPFGAQENRTPGINDGSMKTGSMVSAFVMEYAKETGVPVLGVSASKGGSSIAQWMPDAPDGFLPDALARLAACEAYCAAGGLTLRHRFVLWCQGETDGDHGTPDDKYAAQFRTLLDTLLAHGIEHLFMVHIGRCNIPGSEDRYDRLIALQDKIAADTPAVTMVSTCLAGMRSRGLMKDSFHYYQQAYNEAGEEAARNTAAYVMREMSKGADVERKC